MLNIIVASKDGKLPKGLEHAPAFVLIQDSTPGWAASSNAALARAQLFGGDVLFLDDDTELTATSLEGVRAHYNAADLFGLDLHDMDQQRQPGARHVLTEDGELIDWVQPGPAYVAHVSTSAIYIKERAVSLRFPVWPGAHWEDVAYCIDAWSKGFRVMAVPGYVHHEIVGGVGATKRHDVAFWPRWMVNKQAFEAWALSENIFKRYVVPIGAVEL